MAAYFIVIRVTAQLSMSGAKHGGNRVQRHSYSVGFRRLGENPKCFLKAVEKLAWLL